MSSRSLLQGIFPTQGSNPGLPHCRQLLYCLSHQGSPRILEWVAYHFSSRSFWPRNRTGVSCIAGGFLYQLSYQGSPYGVGSLSLLQGIFLAQESNLGLPHCMRILYWLSHKGSPRILRRVVYPFSSGSSWPRNRTGVSCIVGGFFTNWTIREAQVRKGFQN